jgi:periplasmic protein TonB
VSTSLTAPPGLHRETWRWIAGLLVVLALHAATMLWLIARAPMVPLAAAPALTIDMEPEPAPAPPAAEPEPTPAAAEPQAAPPVAEPEPAPPEPQPVVEPPPPVPEPVADEAIPEQELPAVPQAEVALPPPPKVIEQHRPPPPPKPRPARVRAKQAPAAESPASAPPAAAVQPAPAAPSPAATAVATASWQGQILAHLNRFKRYPAEARMRRHQGVAYLRFTLNRAGRVLRFALDRGSGHELLDQEALALIERAQPLPPPPPELARETFELIVPLQFHLR